MKHILLALLAAFAGSAYAQKTISLDLATAIAMAADSSLTAFRNKNMYLVDYWTYRNYKAERLPSLEMDLYPATYNRTLVSRYDSNTDRDLFRQQKSFSAAGYLSLRQNFDPLGGHFYLSTSVDYLRYFGADTYTQYSSVPVIIGYSHPTLGFNKHKWQRKIEPLKYQKAKLQYLYNAESIAMGTVELFFRLAEAQTNYTQALRQKAASDSLLITGERKYRIAAISKSDLLSLRLDVVNAQNAIATAHVQVKRATLDIATHLGIDRNTQITAVLPGAPSHLSIDVPKALDMMHQNSYMIAEKMQAIAEAEKELDRVKKSSRFNASVNASMGFNQQAKNLADTYKKPMRKDVVQVGVTIPLLNWGMGQGQRNMAQNTLNIARIDAKQKIMELEQDVIITISELEARKSLLENAEKALALANEIYNETVRQFHTGTCSITHLNSAQLRLQNAQSDYVSSMYSYWICYYDLRRQTLFDFAVGFSLSEMFDFDHIAALQ